MKTAISIGVMTVLSGVGAAAWAQAPAPQPAPTQQSAPRSDQGAPQTAPRSNQSAPTQQTAPSSGQRAQTPPSSAAARENSAGQAAPLPDAAKVTASQQLELQAMDSNQNGLVSRQEYMAHYEGLYGSMKKDSAGMISLKDLTASPSPVQPTR